MHQTESVLRMELLFPKQCNELINQSEIKQSKPECKPLQAISPSVGTWLAVNTGPPIHFPRKTDVNRNYKISKALFCSRDQLSVFVNSR